MAKKSLRETLRYHFDNLMSRGTLSLMGFLAVISLSLILIFSIILWLINLIPGKSFIELLWLNIFKVLNTGIIDNAKEGQLNFFLSLIIALISIFIISLLIGLLTSGIQQKIWDLRKGRSKVIEKNHTIVLGWSEIIYTVIESLLEANRNIKKCRIVILGDKDKLEMEDSLRERIKIPKNTRIICRQGNPVNISDLRILNISKSRSVIILDKSDSNVLKTVLAVTGGSLAESGKNPNIVAMLNDENNLDSLRIAGGKSANYILSRDFISRLVAHTCHQPGLSLIYSDLLNFTGNEIYTIDLKELYNKKFRDAVFMFENSSVIGINSFNKVKLNPPVDTIIRENDHIIAISRDDNTVNLSGIQNYDISLESIRSIDNKAAAAEKILIMGFNDRVGIIINELEKYISGQSEITLFADPKYLGEIRNLDKHDIKVVAGDIADYNLVSNLLSEKDFTHIVVLAYPITDIQEADSITLMVLIHLRDIAEKKNLIFSITSEMLDINNRKLAKVAKVNDFIVSDDILSLLIAQVSENPLLDPVFEDLLNSSGSEIYLKDIENYINTREKINFYTVLEAALRKNELVIGYKIAAEMDMEKKNFGIHLNPAKSGLLEFSPGDKLIVLAEK